MSKNELDNIDLKILTVLQAEGRIDMQKLSGLVNLSRTPVALRVEKLIDAGIITRFVGVLDRIRVGRPVLVITYVKLEKQSTALLQAFEAQVATLPEVQSCLHVAGNWNFLLQVSAISPQDYFDFLMRHINGLPNVARTDSTFVLKECKTHSPLPL